MRTAVKKEKNKNQTMGYQNWCRFRRNPAAMFGLVILIGLILLIIFADSIYDYNDMAIKQDFMQRFIKPCAEHPFGTDDYGRDILARIVHGARTSLGIGCMATAFAMILGISVGSIASYFGGALDMVIMRAVDVLMAIPDMLMAMIIVAVFGSGHYTIALALGISQTPAFTRIARGAILTVRDTEYLEAARAISARTPYILIKHALPNSFAPMLVQMTLCLAGTILSVSGLSYLGMGIQAPVPEWGSMLSGARGYLTNAPYMAIFPGAAIMLTILALNLVGDGIRDATDPKLK